MSYGMQLPRATLLEAYRRMKMIREFEARITVELQNGKLPGFFHSYAYGEASAVGTCMNLTDGDFIGSTHRGHGHCIAKGVEVKGMMAEIFGRQDGICGGKGGSMHIADFDKGMLGANAIVGGNPPLVVGAALRAKTLKDGTVSVSFTGDGGSNQGTVAESLNFAVVLTLPAVFVFENNGWGENTSTAAAVGCPSIADRAAAFGMPAVQVDGEDFFAVYDAVQEAVARARAGGGPSTVETKFHRYFGHFVGDPQHYRAKSELENIKQNHDPIAKFRDKVTKASLLMDAELNDVDDDVMSELDRAVEFADASPWPGPEELETNVYAEY